MFKCFKYYTFAKSFKLKRTNHYQHPPNCCFFPASTSPPQAVKQLGLPAEAPRVLLLINLSFTHKRSQSGKNIWAADYDESNQQLAIFKLALLFFFNSRCSFSGLFFPPRGKQIPHRHPAHRFRDARSAVVNVSSSVFLFFFFSSLRELRKRS